MKPSVYEMAHNIEQNALARIALIGGIASIAITANAEASNLLGHYHNGQHLEQISQLPGYIIGISRRAKTDLKNSSIVIENEEHIANGFVDSNSCSGNVVKYNFHRYVSLDAHCEGKITGYNTGHIDAADFNANPGALDFVKNPAYKSVVINPNSYPGNDRPLAYTVGMDVSTRGVDSALLKTMPVGASQEAQSPGLSQHTALPYMETPELIPGQEVALYSSPVSNPVPVAETGRYIGTAVQTYVDGAGQVKSVTDYAVVTFPKSEQSDAGYWGASGSKFAAQATKDGTTTGMHGKVVYSTGGLSTRISLRDVGNAHATGVSRLKESTWIQNVESSTGVAIPNQAVVLLYSDPSVADRRALADSFNSYISMR